MRSAASGTVAEHSTASPGQLAFGPDPNAAGANYLTTAALESSGHWAASTGSPIAPSPARAGSRTQASFNHHPRLADASGSRLRSPPLAESFADRGLTMLARTWGTTTPTGGLPVPEFEDNAENFRQRYEAAATAAARSGAVGPPAKSKRAGSGVGSRPGSAPTSSRRPVPAARKPGTDAFTFHSLGRTEAAGSAVFLTPQKPSSGSASHIRTVNTPGTPASSANTVDYC